MTVALGMGRHGRFPFKPKSIFTRQNRSAGARDVSRGCSVAARGKSEDGRMISCEHGSNGGLDRRPGAGGDALCADGRQRPLVERSCNLAGTSPQAASNHLAKLLEGGLLKVKQSGRHRHYA